MAAPGTGTPTGFSQGYEYPFSAGMAHNATGASALLVAVFCRDNTTTWDPDVATYGGVAMTLLRKSTVEYGGRMWIYGLNAPATGSNNVVVSRVSEAQDSVQVVAFNLTGTKTATPFGTIGTVVTGESGTASVVTTAVDSLVLDIAFGHYYGLTPGTSSPASTSIWTSSNEDLFVSIRKKSVPASGATCTAAYTAPANLHAVSIEVLAPAGAPPAEVATVKRWTGSAWVAKPSKRWNGTAWAGCAVKGWNGNQWRPATGAAATGVKYYDEQNYTKGSYIAYCAPWSIYTPPQDTLVRGTDYEDSIEVFPTFPLNSVIRFRWPNAYSTTGVYGYMAISYGNADGGTPETPVTPWQIGNITSFSQTVDFFYDSGSNNAGMLMEAYACSASGNANSKVYEIAAFLHTTTRTRAFHATGALIGVWTDPQGREWTARDVGPGGTGAPYLIFMRTDGSDAKGTIDFKGMLNFLATSGYSINHLWINGIACGPEPDSLSGTVSLSFQTSLVGSGSVIAAPAGTTGLLANNGFAGGTTSWNGFGFNGKSVVAGKATFNATPAYDGIDQNITLTVGKYYQVSLVITRTAGSIVPRFVGGATQPGIGEKNASGTYVGRILAATGNNNFQLLCESAGFSGTVDDIVITGPFNTATVDGA